MRIAVLLAPAPWAKHVALAAALVEFAISVPMWWTFEPAAGMQFRFDAPWMPAWGMRYHRRRGRDLALSRPAHDAARPAHGTRQLRNITTRERGYYSLLLVLTSGMIGVFVALDLFLFYVMWEVMLIPMYFIIGVWGGERPPVRGTQVLHLYVLGLAAHAGRDPRARAHGRQRTGRVLVLLRALDGGISATVGPRAYWFFGAFFLAFAIKVPVFPFHTWLPDAHAEAPTAGSVILAGVLLKMGTYGFLRFALPVLPAGGAAPGIQPHRRVARVVGIIYGGLVAMVQPDFKRLIAYSSVAHLGFVMLGIWALTLQSMQGALLIMINHGISTGALFFIVGMLYERRHSRLDRRLRRLARVVPASAAILTVVSLSSIALPGTNGFVGEFLVLIGAFRRYPVAATV